MLRIKEVRKLNHVSQQQLAEIIGVSRSAVAMWETEKSQPDTGNLLAIASYFNVSTDYLLGHEVGGEERRAPVLDERESHLLELFGELNNEGKDKLADIADDLVRSGKYTTE